MDVMHLMAVFIELQSGPGIDRLTEDAGRHVPAARVTLVPPATAPGLDRID